MANQITKLQAFKLVFNVGKSISSIDVDKSASDLKQLATCTLHDAYHSFTREFGVLEKISDFKKTIRSLAPHIEFMTDSTGCERIAGISLIKPFV